MRSLRLFWRSCAIAPITLGSWLVLLVGLVLLAPHPPSQRAFRRGVFRTWSRLLLWVLGVRVEVEGELPPQPVFLISNHLSYLDILVLASLVPARFVAKAEISGWPLAGWISQSASTIFVDRSLRRDVLRVGELIADALDEGDSVVLFPEGTSTNGRTVDSFKTPLLAPAAAAELTVMTSTLGYETTHPDPPAFNAVCWWGLAPFGPHIVGLLKLGKVRSRVAFGSDQHQETNRKQLAADLHADVLSRFEPMVDHEPADPWEGDPRSESSMS